MSSKAFVRERTRGREQGRKKGREVRLEHPGMRETCHCCCSLSALPLPPSFVMAIRSPSFYVARATITVAATTQRNDHTTTHPPTPLLLLHHHHHQHRFSFPPSLPFLLPPDLPLDLDHVSLLRASQSPTIRRALHPFLPPFLLLHLLLLLPLLLFLFLLRSLCNLFIRRPHDGREVGN